MTTPLNLAQTWCANWQDGACTGAQLNDAGQVTIAKPLPACLLAQPVKRCAYFEQCVAPMETTLKAQLNNRADWPKDDRARAAFPRLVENFSHALHQYRIQTGSMFSAKRKCPDCQTRPLEPYKQRCAVCQDAKKKESQRQRDAKRGHNSTES